MDDAILSDRYDGIMRTLYPKSCVCGTVFCVPKHIYNETKYCSRECSAKGRQSRIVMICAICQKSFERPVSKKNRSKSGLFFCSRECKEKAQSLEGGIEAVQPEHYGDGLTSYRQRAIRHYGAVCSKCGYSEYEQMLDVDHIDSDRSNGALENLQVLCVWCHALKTRDIPYHERKTGA